MNSRNKQRRNYFIDKRFQTRFVARFILIILASSGFSLGLLALLFKNSSTVAIENTKVIVKTTADFILPMVCVTFIIALVFSSVAAIVLTVIFSHKISGPLFRLTREVESFESGDLTRTFQTRGKDQLQAFSCSLQRMAVTMRKRVTGLKARHEALKNLLVSTCSALPEADKAAITAQCQAISDDLNNFQTS
jgi:methyl-accepting chemotaxis protein